MSGGEPGRAVHDAVPSPDEALAGWFPAEDPASERWWDGHRWSSHVRPTPHPTRVRWAGLRWGGTGGPVLQVVTGTLLLLGGRVSLLVALEGGALLLPATAVTLVAVIGGAMLLVNASFCWRLESRRRPAGVAGPPPEAQLAHVRWLGVLWGVGRGWSQRSFVVGSVVTLAALFAVVVTLLTWPDSAWGDAAVGGTVALVLALLGAMCLADGWFRLVLERRRRAAGIPMPRRDDA